MTDAQTPLLVLVQGNRWFVLLAEWRMSDPSTSTLVA